MVSVTLASASGVDVHFVVEWVEAWDYFWYVISMEFVPNYEIYVADFLDG